MQPQEAVDSERFQVFRAHLDNIYRGKKFQENGE